MQETVGTVELKIARLEHCLRILRQQQAMSDNYPTYKANLAQKELQARLRLRQLIQDRQKLSDLGLFQLGGCDQASPQPGPSETEVPEWEVRTKDPLAGMALLAEMN